MDDDIELYNPRKPKSIRDDFAIIVVVLIHGYNSNCTSLSIKNALGMIKAIVFEQ